jgi:hypothetical protein
LKKRSRPQRWKDAVTELVTPSEGLQGVAEALLESLQDSKMAETLYSIRDLDLSEVKDS